MNTNQYLLFTKPKKKIMTNNFSINDDVDYTRLPQNDLNYRSVV